MKKLVFAAAAFAAISLSACTELHSDIKPITASDTTYVATLETQSPRSVMVEEYTGVKCVNCPEGAAILTAAHEANAGRVVVIGLHSGSLTSPLDESKYNFQTEHSLNLMGSFFGEDPPKPAASIDRVKTSGSFFSGKGFWQQHINNRLAVPAKQNITITSDFNAQTRRAIITVRVAYTVSVTQKQKLMVAITEDKIVDAQLFPLTHELDYEHNHVLRDFLTLYSGAGILEGITIEPGRVYEQTFVYENINEAWNAENCRIVAFVFNDEADSKEVQQAAEAHLVQ